MALTAGSPDLICGIWYGLTLNSASSCVLFFFAKYFVEWDECMLEDVKDWERFWKQLNILFLCA